MPRPGYFATNVPGCGFCGLKPIGICGAGYDRVRREFTASAARRALRNAYEVIAERFAEQFGDSAEDEAPKVEILADDDFEATVFEEAPQAPPVDTALNRIEDPDQLELVVETGHTSSNSVVAPPPPAEITMERNPVAPPPTPAKATSGGGWTKSDLTPPAPPHEDWVVTNVAAAISRDDDDEARATRPIEHEDDDEALVPQHDDGTPVEGLIAPPPPPQVSSENAFVAGEIDVPTPAPDLDRAKAGDEKTPAVEFTAASSLLGNADPADPDTGSHTPPLERRSS